ncbi:alkaline phosphatase [Gemmatimonadetes bacterium T265]|nr:alkaline phosphatase [Gemmatimonadetes bacterium T265]
MFFSIRSLAAAAVLVTHAASRAAAQPATSPGAPQPRPTLVVFLTVDQMRADYLTTRFGAGLTGGLKRLRDGGALFTNAHQDHAITETAPGHASTLSGRFPAHTGIVRNAVGVQDPRSPLLAGGTTGPASPFRFRGSALVDWMRAADPRSRALSVSRKDRGAIFPMGRARQSVFWYGGNGRFVTSRYYADTLPDWVKRFDGDTTGSPAPIGAVAARYAGRRWTPIAPAIETEPDSVPVENGGQDYVFPHVLSADPDTAARTLAEFPFMDEATLGFALAGVRAMHLGAGPAPDVLAISLSTTDAIGHRYGMDSRELHDQILRLDRSLGAFLDTLFTLRDSARVLVALTADHGMQPYPALHFPPNAPRHGYAEVGSALTGARAALAARGVTGGGFEFESGMLTVDSAAFARAGVSADSTVAAMAAELRRVPGVASVLLRRDLAPRAAAGDVYARRWLHMTPDDSPAAAFVSLAPFYYWGGTNSATHGSPNDDDTHVPVLFWGAPFRPGQYPAFARVVDMAPTLAAVLGVRPTEALDGVVLQAALR